MDHSQVVPDFVGNNSTIVGRITSRVEVYVTATTSANVTYASIPNNSSVEIYTSEIYSFTDSINDCVSNKITFMT